MDLNNTDVTTPRTPTDFARTSIVRAQREGDRVKSSFAAGDPRQAGIHANRERQQLKYAEVGALLAIADELARIGLSR